MVTAVVFDVGETVLDDSREWGAWADWIGVPRHTFSVVLGAVAASGRDSSEVFQVFRPGFDVARERELREAAGRGEQVTESDLHPDVRQCIATLNRQGLWVGLAGNSPGSELLRSLKLPVDQIATSGDWGVAKPDPAFFDQVIAMAPGSPQDIVYVGDHRDEDVVPAKAAGLRTVLIRRGPWGHLWAHDSTADWVIDSLAELPALVALASRQAGLST